MRFHHFSSSAWHTVIDEAKHAERTYLIAFYYLVHGAGLDFKSFLSGWRRGSIRGATLWSS